MADALEERADTALRKWLALEMPGPCDFVGDPAENLAGRVYSVRAENEELRRLCPKAVAMSEEMFAMMGTDEQSFLIDQAKDCVAFTATMIIQLQEAAVAFLVEECGEDPSDPSVAADATDFAVYVSNVVHAYLKETEGMPPVLGLVHLDALLAAARDDPAQLAAITRAVNAVAERMNAPGQVYGSGDLIGDVLECRDCHELAAALDRVERRIPSARDLFLGPEAAALPGVEPRFVLLDDIEADGGTVARRGGRMRTAVGVSRGAGGGVATRRGDADGKNATVVDRANKLFRDFSANRFVTSLAVGYNLGAKFCTQQEYRILVALTVAVGLEFGERIAGTAVDAGVGLATGWVPRVGPLRHVEPFLRGMVRALGSGWTAVRNNSALCLLFSRLATVLNLVSTAARFALFAGIASGQAGWFFSLGGAVIAGLDMVAAYASLGSAAPDAQLNSALLRDTRGALPFQRFIAHTGHKQGAVLATRVFNPASWAVGSDVHAAFCVTSLVTDLMQSGYIIANIMMPGVDGLSLWQRLEVASKAEERVHAWSALVACIGDLVIPAVIAALSAGTVSDDVARTLMYRIGMAAVALNGVVLVGANEKARRIMLESMIALAKKAVYPLLGLSYMLQAVVRVLAIVRRCLDWVVVKGAPGASLPAAITFDHRKQSEEIRASSLALRMYMSTEVPLAVAPALLDLRLRDDAPLFVPVEAAGSTVRFEPLDLRLLAGLRAPPVVPCDPEELCAWIAHASNYVMANIARAARVSTTATELNQVRIWRAKKMAGDPKRPKRT